VRKVMAKFFIVRPFHGRRVARNWHPPSAGPARWVPISFTTQGLRPGKPRAMRSHRVIAVLFAGIVAAACGGGDGGTNPPDNQAPVAAFTAPSCTVGVPCQFTDASTDPDGNDDITTR